MTHLVSSNKFQSIPGKVFDSLGIAVDITYRSRADAEYVPGGSIEPYFTEETSRAILDAPTNEQLQQGALRATDKVLLIPRLELTAVPKPDDLVIIQGRQYMVLSPVQTDPAEALWTVPVRG